MHLEDDSYSQLATISKQTRLVETLQTGCKTAEHSLIASSSAKETMYRIDYCNSVLSGFMNKRRLQVYNECRMLCSTPSLILIRPNIWPQYNNVTDRTGQDNGPIA